MKTSCSCCTFKNFIENYLGLSVMLYLLTLQWTYSLIEYFVLLKRAHRDESIRMFLFWRLQRLVLYCAQRLLVYVYFHIKMSNIRSFAKAKEKSEKTEHNSQIAEEKTASNKKEPWIKPLAPPQQSSVLKVLDVEATVQNINTIVSKKRGSYQKFRDTDQFHIAVY